MDSKTILIADDEYGFRYPIRIYLDNLKFNVIEASNKEEVFENISQANILMMDVIFPAKREGIDIVKEIRKHKDEKVRNIPVIFYSILNEIMFMDELKGIDKYVWLQKPFEFSAILNALRELKQIT